MNATIVKIGRKVWILVSLVMWGGICYLLGNMQAQQQLQSDISIVYPTEAAVEQVIAEPTSSPEQSSHKMLEGDFVASKNGTKYYPKGCSGVNRIKPENRVYFATEDQAISMGLTLSKTCQ